MYIEEVFNIFQLRRHLRSLATDTSGKLDILWHDGNSLGVDGSKVGIFEKADKV
jgi:hypothetical protein